MNITSKDISVVVQGPIHTQDNLTKRVLESVRTHLPDAELILSTWKGSDVEGLDYDILLLNEDPGAINGRNNVNRQIVSTRNGLQKATRTYAMKLRTDTLLTGTGFIDAFDKYPERREDFKVFEHKIVIPTLYTRNPLRPFPYGSMSFFHPSDIFHFGLRFDLLLLWSLPNATKDNAINLLPEQYIWINCLKYNFQQIDFSKLSLKDSLLLSELSLVNNFIIDTPSNLGIVFTEHLMNQTKSLCYSESEIKQLIERYIIKNSGSITLRYLIYLPVILFWKFFSGIHLNLGIRRLWITLNEKVREKQT